MNEQMNEWTNYIILGGEIWYNFSWWGNLILGPHGGKFFFNGKFQTVWYCSTEQKTMLIQVKENCVEFPH